MMIKSVLILVKIAKVLLITFKIIIILKNILVVIPVHLAAAVVVVMKTVKIILDNIYQTIQQLNKIYCMNNNKNLWALSFKLFKVHHTKDLINKEAQKFYNMIKMRG